MLTKYTRKRDFKKTPEPAGKTRKPKEKQLMFVVQEHHSSHLHFDFRLEWKGVLKSWAVPKGPTTDPDVKRLAVQVEDHPYEYGKFEGEIPEGEYGGGEVLLWDTGTWEPEGSVDAGLNKGHLDFSLKGKRMKGRWTLVRLKSTDAKPNWLLFKRHDQYAGDDSLFHQIKDYGSRKERPKTPKIKTTAFYSGKKPIPFTPPQLPLLVDHPPEGDEWIHEMKFDGYRIQAHIRNNKAHLFTRTGLDWTEKYPQLAEKLGTLPVNQAVLDGEIVALDEKGRSDFQELQLAMKSGRSDSLIYYGFDLLALDGKDLRDQPLLKRKEELQKLLKNMKEPLIRYSEHLATNSKSFLAASCAHHLEGIVSKKVDSPYTSGRNSLWVKTKCYEHQEFVIGGYTEPRGARKWLGALLLGIYEKGKFRYVGKCGTGFDEQTLGDLHAKLSALETAKQPFEINAPKEPGTHWVSPKLVAEVSFSMWTRDQLLRVPVFQGLREDKPPREIKKEEPKRLEEAAVSSLTHPDKVMYPKEGISKKDIADYYEAVAPFMLPHIRDRPLALLRCPDGTKKECFFQKHVSQQVRKDGVPASFHEVKIKEKSGTKPYITIDSADGLQEFVQMGAFELHCWGSRQPDIEHPDQIVIDFDPSPQTSFGDVKRAAFELKRTLGYLGLVSFVKLSGGKGLHVHIPIVPLYSWNEVKEFSRIIAEEMAGRFPLRYVTTVSKAARKGKIFIDYLRNGRGSTAVVPYSLRARETSSVALPIRWSDLPKIRSPSQFTLKKTLAYLKKRRTDPWKWFLSSSQRILILDPEN